MKLRFSARLIAAVLLCVVARAPASATPAGDALHRTYAREVEAFLRDQPMLATILGDDRYDGSLGLSGAAALAQLQTDVRRLEREIDAIDMRGATLRERDDLALIRANIASQQRGIAQTMEGKDAGAPPFTFAVTIFTMVLNRGGQDSGTWWDHVIARLEQAPAWLTAARGLVTHPGRVQGEVGSQRTAFATSMLTTVLTGMATELSPEKRTRFEHARDGAVAALSDWKKWLDANDASWPANYAMGRAAYDRMLKDEYLVPYDAPGIAALGEGALKDAIADESDALADATARNINLVDPVLATAQGGGAVPATKDAAFAFFSQSVEALTRFTREKHIVTIPPYMGTVKVVETPAFLLPLIAGPLVNAPPLLAPAQYALYFVPPVLPATLVDFDWDRVLLTTGHDGLPGHFLQLSIAKRNPDPVRRYGLDFVFAEGWALYVSRLLQGSGLYGSDLDGRYAIAQFARLRAARTVVDARLATGEWGFDRAVTWFREAAGVDGDTAKSEVSRWALAPGQGFADVLGVAQIDDLVAKVRARKGTRFNLQAFDDDLLAHGTVPISIVTREILAE